MSVQVLVDTVAVSLPIDPPPSEAEIDARLTALGPALSADEETIEAARRELHSRYRVVMDLGRTLEEEGHEPWLAARRGVIEWYYWPRYRQYLLRRGWPPLVVGTLDRATDDLLDLLGNPSAGNAWKRRGLVMGDVQSGKTATYTALIAKAADAGYRMVILLTGTLENVRRQTQLRLDEGFVGFDSGGWLTRMGIGRTALVGVGQINQKRQAIVFTSRTYDFRTVVVEALNLGIDAVNEPILVVCKKNAAVLRNLTMWLRSRSGDRSGRIAHPMLLIDDEADNASVNTRMTPDDTTAINRGIRDLLAIFHRSTYVGFTATPFANIFIDPDTTDEMLGDDLFPADFIHVLEPPTNYVGMNVLFADTDGEQPEPLAGSVAAQVLRVIEDADDWMPADHKKDYLVEGLPDSLTWALATFLLSTAIRDLRAIDGDDGGGGGLHRSMLVNVTRFTDIQNALASTLHNALDGIRNAVKLYGALDPVEAQSSSEVIAFLRKVFDEEFGHAGKPWGRVLHVLHEAISPVTVRAVNQSTGAASLDYTVVNELPGLRVIAVGGNSLSRGLTLEGLAVSYFLRNSRTYDTLMQMGRWFGYRDGYGDLCRVWLTEEAEGWYRHISAATRELRQDFRRMHARGAAPREFGLRVRRHPDTLMITARNKMATGMNVEGVVREISLDGRMVETSRLYADRRRNEENLEYVRRFISGMTGRPDSPHGSAVLWHGVSADKVGVLLRAFRTHPLNHDYQGDSIADMLDESASQERGLSRWAVALISAGDGEPVDLPPPVGTVPTQVRHVREDRDRGSLLVSGRSARVGTRRDVRHGLTLPQWLDLVAQAEDRDPRKVSEDACREEFSLPLLVIYLLRGVIRQPDKSTLDYRERLILPALALHFPGVKTVGEERVVSYRLNRIAQRELLPDIDDDDDWRDYEDLD